MPGPTIVIGKARRDGDFTIHPAGRTNRHGARPTPTLKDTGSDGFGERFKMEGWLYPAVFNYFPEASMQIYVKAEPKQ